MFGSRCSTTLLLAVSAVARAQSAVKVIDLAPPNATLTPEFTSVTSVRELADGRVLLTDIGEKRLMVGDWKAGTTTQVGRNGSGPGEYLQPGSLVALPDDSTLLPDLQNGRWLLLRGSAIVATIGADAPALRNGARSPIGADGQGRLIFVRGLAQSGSGRGEMPRRDSSQLLRVERAMGAVDSLERLRARPMTMKIQGPADNPTSISITTNPMAPGELAVAFADGWIAIARLEPYRVDWIMPNGKRIHGAALPFERVRLDEREQRAFVEREAARSGRTPRDPSTFPEWPEYIPPFLNLGALAGPDGRLWIQRAPTAANPYPPYDVVDRRGVLVARVAAGKDVQVLRFGRGVVFTTATDENGIQRLQRRPLPAF
jgi:hypothetical protein